MIAILEHSILGYKDAKATGRALYNTCVELTDQLRKIVCSISYLISFYIFFLPFFMCLLRI